MASPVEICNMALSKLGSEPITTIDDATPRARWCKLFYQTCVDAVLADGNWNFAMRRASLSQLTTGPEFGYEYAYQLPIDCLRVVSVEYTDTEWKVEGKTIVTDEESLNIQYIARVEEGEFSGLFTILLSYRLAAELAYPITRDESRSKALYQMYTENMKIARSTDAIEGSPDQLESTALTEVR